MVKRMKLGMIAAMVILAGCVGFGAAEKADGVGDPAGVVLDTGSFWRCFFGLADPVFGEGQAAKPREPTKRDLHWNSSPPPADWMKPEFDDGNWWRAPAPFYGGYGFASQNYVVQPDTIALIALRGKFAVEAPAKVKAMTFSLAYRGGVVIYVNGKELKRAYLPEGPITVGTPAENYPIEAYVVPAAAAKGVSTNDKPAAAKAIRWGWGDPAKYKDRCELRIRKVENVAIPSDMLRKGMNVLAIEVHRAPYPADYFKVGSWYDGFRCHAGVLSIQLKTDSPTVVGSNVGRPKGFQVWNANPMMAVFDMDYGDPVEPLNPIRIPGCRNGRFSGQIVVSCDAAIEGLKATMGDLVKKDGSGSMGLTAGGSPRVAAEGTIAAANVQIRYAKPGGFEKGSEARYGTGEVSRFDPLQESEPMEVPIYTKQRGRSPYGAVQPIWVTVAVPADAVAGEYEGTLTISANAQKDVAVSVVMRVADWTLPDSKDYVTFVDMVQSPESLALYYDVPLWSDRHWVLIEKTFEQLGRIGNKSVYIPLIGKTHFGNSDTMVRWVKQADGSYKGDFSIMEKYLDIAEKYQGKPSVVCFIMWEHDSGGGYFADSSDYSKWARNLVSSVDPETKKIVSMETPGYGDPQAETAWKPICEELESRIKKRGLEKSLMIGICSDVRAATGVVDLWKRLLPDARWVIHSHGLESQLHGVPVGYSATVWRAGYAWDPEVDHTYGWNRKPGAPIVAQFCRDLVFGWELTQNKLLPENNIGGTQSGFGRNGADFFPPFKNAKGQRFGMLAGRYRSDWNQLSLKTCFLAPGPDGALGTVRFESMREGVQECEARISIEKVLLDKVRRAKLGEEKARKIQDLLDERIRAGLWGKDNYGWYVSSGWQDRSARLYSTAAEVAKIAGDR